MVLHPKVQPAFPALASAPRRRAIAFFAALAAGWLPAGHAQRVFRIAVLLQGTKQTTSGRFDALRAGLQAHGYVEGRNLHLAVRWNEGALERLPDLAAELLRDKPDVFVGAPVLAAAAAHKHSRTVPIVIAYGAGAVKIGLAKSFARPGGNVTGMETQTEELIQKNLELLKTIAPGMSRLGVINTGNYLFHEEAWGAAAKTAQLLRFTLVDLRVRKPEDIARLALACGKEGCDGLYAMPDPLTINWREPMIELAAKMRVPAIYFQPEFVQEGGLLSYSANIEDMFRRAAGHVDKILKGAKPADLPIERPTRFELMVNQKTAKALGISNPQSILLRADKIIE